MNKGLKLILGFLPLILICLLVFWFSSKNAEQSLSQSDILVKVVKERLMPSLQGIKTKRDINIVDRVISVGVRKTAHFVAYTILGICAFGALWFIKRKGLRYTAAVMTCALYAGSDEIHQLFVAGRTGQLRDVIIDSSGAAMGALICLIAVLIIQMQGMKDEIAELKQELEMYRQRKLPEAEATGDPAMYQRTKKQRQR